MYSTNEAAVRLTSREALKVLGLIEAERLRLKNLMEQNPNDASTAKEAWEKIDSLDILSQKLMLQMKTMK